jgi:hypothetical protein
MFGWLKRKQTIAEADPAGLDLNMLAMQRAVLLAKLTVVAREQLRRHQVALSVASGYSDLHTMADAFAVSVDAEARFAAALEAELARVVRENPALAEV